MPVRVNHTTNICKEDLQKDADVLARHRSTQAARDIFDIAMASAAAPSPFTSVGCCA